MKPYSQQRATGISASFRMSILLTLHQHHFRLCGIKAAELPENTLLFAKEEQEGISGETPVERTFDYHFVDQLPAPPTEGDGSGWVLTFARYNITVWRRGQEERRMLAVSSPADAYAVYEETSATHADVWVLEDIRKDMHVDTIFISTLSMERHLARHGIAQRLAKRQLHPLASGLPQDIHEGQRKQPMPARRDFNRMLVLAARAQDVKRTGGVVLFGNHVAYCDQVPRCRVFAPGSCQEIRLACIKQKRPAESTLSRLHLDEVERYPGSMGPQMCVDVIGAKQQVLT